MTEAYYGLPENIVYCTRCSNSNQKPNSEKEYKHNINTKKPTIEFDENGVCSACKVSSQKKSINWDDREKLLIDLCNKYRRNDGRYDCLVPGSGGKDSFYAAHKLKYEFGMNPLTVTWAPHIYTDWGWKNFQSWIHSGFDNYLFTPNGKVHRLLTRIALEKLFHPFQPFIMGQMYFPPKIAANLDIPLVFYGENPAEYGNKSNSNLTAKKETSFFSSSDIDNFYIAGTSVKDLQSIYNLTLVDLEPYMPADNKIMQSKNINVQYLGYYMPWHPQECFYYAVENGNFSAAPERSTGTYSKYSSIDDKIDDFHYYTTFIKFGIGRATYDSCQEIRNGEITRDEAIALIKRFDGEYPKRFEDEVFQYLSIKEEEFPKAYNNFSNPILNYDVFSDLTDKFRSPHLWKKENNKWTLKKPIYKDDN